MIVVDSAAVVDALSVVAGTLQLRARLATDELHAPDLLDYEIVSALRELTLGGELSAARAEDALRDFDELLIHRWPARHQFRQRAFQLRDRMTAHDAAYVVLAEALGCPLLTRDARLARSGNSLVELVVL